MMLSTIPREPSPPPALFAFFLSLPSCTMPLCAPPAKNSSRSSSSSSRRPASEPKLLRNANERKVETRHHERESSNRYWQMLLTFDPTMTTTTTMQCAFAPTWRNFAWPTNSCHWRRPNDSEPLRPTHPSPSRNDELCFRPLNKRVLCRGRKLGTSVFN